MAGWRRICCALDFSDRSRAAMRQAAELANQLGAELLLVHVRHGPARGAGTPFAPPPQPGAAGEQGEELTAWTAEAQRLASGRATSVEISGHPATEIVRLAREFGCDAIFVGTHARSALGRLALGSVAEEIVQAAECPVVVVRSVAAP